MITVMVMLLFYRNLQKYDEWRWYISLYYPEESLEVQVLKHKKVMCYLQRKQK